MKKFVRVILVPNIGSLATNYFVNDQPFIKDPDVSWNQILEMYCFENSTVLQSTYSTNGVAWTIISKN